MDSRVGCLALVTTIVAIADTVAPTPEDLYPLAGWIDEFVLWGLSAKFWISFIKGEKLEEVLGI